jgi:GT2 family glycosyltransferase
MIVRRDVWTRLEGFDPLFFFHWQETDFCWRVWLSGHRVVFVPSAKVFHTGGITTSKLRGDIYCINSEFLYYRNRIIMVAKNLELKNLIKYFPWLCSMYLYWIMLSIRRNHSGSILGNFLGTIWCLRFFKSVWSKRLIIQQMRNVRDADLFKRRAIYATIFI